jgi:HSP20 family protein
MAKRGIPPNVSRRLSEQAREGAAAAPLRELFDRLAEAAEALSGGGELPFSLGGKEGRAVFGYTVRTGLDGVRAERFGDMPRPATAQGPAPRAPIVDVFEEGELIRVVAELPGVAAENIICTLEKNVLHIKTTGPQIYARSVQLPAASDRASLSQTCSNGILEVRLQRTQSA